MDKFKKTTFEQQDKVVGGETVSSLLNGNYEVYCAECGGTICEGKSQVTAQTYATNHKQSYPSHNPVVRKG